MQTSLFWLTGGAFFALQLGMLLYLLYGRPRGGLPANLLYGSLPGELPARGERRRRVEIVWTLVPASLLVAVVLMVSGFTGSSWNRIRGAAARDAASLALQQHHQDTPSVRSDAAR